MQADCTNTTDTSCGDCSNAWGENCLVRMQERCLKLIHRTCRVARQTSARRAQLRALQSGQRRRTAVFLARPIKRLSTTSAHRARNTRFGASTASRPSRAAHARLIRRCTTASAKVSLCCCAQLQSLSSCLQSVRLAGCAKTTAARFGPPLSFSRTSTFELQPC